MGKVLPMEVRPVKALPARKQPTKPARKQPAKPARKAAKPTSKQPAKPTRKSAKPTRKAKRRNLLSSLTEWVTQGLLLITLLRCKHKTFHTHDYLASWGELSSL